MTSSKKDYRKEERTQQRKAAKGKTGNSHLESQRLIGGQQAIPHSWPWQVFVKIEGKSGGYDCGGSIIGTQVLDISELFVSFNEVAFLRDNHTNRVL